MNITTKMLLQVTQFARKAWLTGIYVLKPRQDTCLVFLLSLYILESHGHMTCPYSTYTCASI